MINVSKKARRDLVFFEKYDPKLYSKVYSTLIRELEIPSIPGIYKRKIGPNYNLVYSVFKDSTLRLQRFEYINKKRLI